MSGKEAFYKKVVSKHIASKTDSVLVCGGGQLDKEILQSCGLRNVTISNLDSRMDSDQYLPFHWSYQNATNLSFDDNTFDYVIAHASIHHASSPHKMLTEMYRVAKKGTLCIESRDSLTMNIFSKLGLSLVYECSAVYHNQCSFGGCDNTEIPNFVYRWTEREIEKTINSYAPHFKHTVKYDYSTAFPENPVKGEKIELKHLLSWFGRPLFFVFASIFPRQQNLFAFYIEKPELSKALHPWLKHKDGVISFNKEWADKKYKKGN